MHARFNHFSIAGICAAVPSGIQRVDDLIRSSSPDVAFTIKRVAALAGLEQRHVASSDVFTGDLAVAAGKYLLEKLQWDPESVSMLFLGTQSPDFLSPPVGYLVAAKLGMNEHCAITDVTTGCPGLIHLAWLAAAHLGPKRKRALILCGDVPSKFVPMSDTGNVVLMGDGMGAMALEYEPDAATVSFNIASYPDTDFAIAHYGSGYKNVAGKEPGGEMKGDVVTNFTFSEVPDSIMEHLTRENLRIDDLDVFFMHQPNKRILDTLMRRLGVENSRMPIVLRQYANCCGASAAFSACSWNPENPDPVKAMFCVFGTGLSVASMICNWDPSRSFGVIDVQKGILWD